MFKTRILSLIFFLTIQILITYQTPNAFSSDLNGNGSLDIKERFTETGEASWYGPGFHGRKTASGEIFDTYEFTAAHKYLPFGTLLKVTNLSNNLSTVVRVNDRGPYSKNRIIDLSKASKTAIGMDGVAKVRIIEITEEEAELLRSGIDPFENIVESESNTSDNSTYNLLDNQVNTDSKLFLEKNGDDGSNNNSDLNQNLNKTGNLKVKIITPKSGENNLDKNLYQKIDNIDYLIRFYDPSNQFAVVKGYMIEVSSFDDKQFADRFIGRLERDGFSKIYLEEIISNDAGLDKQVTTYKVLVGLFQNEKSATKDLMKLKKLNYNSKLVKIGLE